MLAKYNNLSRDFFEYPDKVLSGQITACESIKLACVRYMSFFDNPEYYFDGEKAAKIINFVEHLTHFQGEFAGQSFRLMSWQKFLIYNIFCWFYENDHSRRLTTDVFMLISRKSAKTATIAALALAEMCVTGEAASETYIIANSREQAKIAFNFCSHYARGLDPRKKHFKVYRDYIIYPKLDSKIKVLSSDTMSADGYSPSMAIIDEYHAATTNDAVEVMKSGMAARKSPLTCIISSAGFLLDGYPCYELYKLGKRVLKGEIQDDRSFYLIFELDEGDDWRDEKNWKKCAPSYGVIAQYDYYASRVHEAEINPMSTNKILTKNFNKFISGSVTWLSPEIMAENYIKVDLDQLENEFCYLGLDLSSTRDITAVSLCFPPNPDRVYYPEKTLFKTWFFLPNYAYENSENATLYKMWRAQGLLTVTAGNSLDQQSIINLILELHARFTVHGVSYDPWHAALLIQNLIAEGLLCVPTSQSIGNFNRPTSHFEVICLNHSVLIDDNTVWKWMLSNCELKEDKNSNRKPCKAGDNPLRKIDGIISCLMALCGYITNQMPIQGDVGITAVPYEQVMSGII